jgi:microcin C transport system substrate-binding protein
MNLAKRNDLLRQLDNRLTAIMPYVLLWQNDRTRLLYWNKFGTPKSVFSKFDREDSATVYWWSDPEKLAALEKARRADSALPPLAAEVHYAE